MQKRSLTKIIDKLTSRATTQSVLALIIGIVGIITISKLAMEGNKAAIEIIKIAFAAIISFYYGKEEGKKLVE